MPHPLPLLRPPLATPAHRASRLAAWHLSLPMPELLLAIALGIVLALA